MRSSNEPILLLNKEPLKEKRYCGGRFTKIQWISLIIVFTVLLILVIALPIVYFVTIPHLIRENFKKLGESKGPMDPIERLDINHFEQNGFNISAKTLLPPLMPGAPIPFGLRDPLFYVGSSSDQKLIQLHLKDDLHFKLSDKLPLDTDIDIQFYEPHILNQYVQTVLSKDPNMKDLVISSNLNVEIFGFLWYRGLHVEKVVSMKDKILHPAVESDLDAESHGIKILPAIAVSEPNKLIRAKYPQKDLISSGDPSLPDVYWKDMDMNMNDDGMGAMFAFEMQNPTIVTLSIPSISFYVGVEGVNLAEIQLTPLDLTHDLNNMAFGFQVIFQDQTDASLSDLFGKLLAGSPASINGPLKINGTLFADEIINNQVSIELPAIPLSNGSQSSSKGLDSPQDILAKSQVSIDVEASTIHIPFTFVLSKLWPLPSSMTFPVTTQVGVLGGASSSEIMSLEVSPIVMKTDDYFFNITSSLDIKFINSDEAANALASSVNPILSVTHPQNSSIGVGSLKFLEKDHVLKWSEKLFKDHKVDVPLKPLCLLCESQESTSPSMDLKLPTIEAKQVRVNQLSDAPGFGLGALLNHDALPIDLEMQLGYFGFHVDTFELPFLEFELPQGIHVNSVKSDMDIQSRLVFSHHESVGQRTQSLVNTLTGDSNESAVVGMSNLVLGSAPNNLIKTLSKVVVEIDALRLKQKHLLDQSSIGTNEQRTSPLAVLKRADFEIIDSHHVRLGGGANLNGMEKFSVDIGSVGIEAMLDNEKLVSLKTDPLSVMPQKEVDLGMQLELVSGNSKLSERIAQIVDALKNKREIDDTVSVTGLVLEPKGVHEGNAIIDQFKLLTIKVPLSSKPESSSRDSVPLVDTSQMLSGDLMSAFKVSPKKVDFETLPGSRLELNADLDYQSQIPLTVKIPFLKLGLKMEDVSLVDSSLHGVSVEAGAHSMSAGLGLYFQQHDPSIQDHVFKFVHDLQNGRTPDVKLVAGGVTFGGSDKDQNDLFSLIQLDISNLIKPKLPSVSSLMSGSSATMKLPSPKIHKVEFNMLPQKQMDLKANVDLFLDSIVKANIGTLGFGLRIHRSPFMRSSIQGLAVNPGNSSQNLNVYSHIVFDEVQDTPDKVAELVKNLQEGKKVESAVGLTHFDIGLSEQDKISTFSKVVLILPVDDLMEKMKQSAPSTMALPAELALPPIDPLSVMLAFGQGKSIDLDASVSSILPFDAFVSIPFLDVETLLDGTPAIYSHLGPLTIFENGKNTSIQIKTHLVVHDSDALTDKVGVVSSALVHGEKTEKAVGIKGLRFGASEQDCVQSFSKMDLQLPIDPLTKASSQKLDSPLKKEFASPVSNIQIKDVSAKTEAGKEIHLGVKLGFLNQAQITIQGLGHVAATALIDNVPVVHSSLDGIHMEPGSNNLDIQSKMQFTSSGESQQEISKLVSDVISKANLTQMVGCSGIEFGLSDTDYIKMLSKAQIGFKASELLSQKPNIPLPGGIDPKTVLKNLVVKKNNVDFSKPDVVMIDIDVTVSNLTLPASVDIGYIGAFTQLEEPGLAKVSIENLKITHTDDSVSLQCHVEFGIQKGDDLKKTVAQLVQNIETHGVKNVTTYMQLSDFHIGLSENDRIDSFDLIKVKQNPLSLLPPDALNMITLDTAGKPSMKLDIVYADVLDSSRLGAEIFAHIVGDLPITLKLPYARLSGRWADAPFMEIEALDMLVENGNVTLNGIMTQHRNFPAAEELAVIVGNVLFHRSQNVTAKMEVSGVRFGASKDSNFDLLELVKLVTPLASAIDGITEVVNRPESLIELVEMKSSLSPTGIMASFVGKPFPSILPFAAKPGAGAAVKIGYGPKGEQEIVNIVYKDIVFFPGRPFTGISDIKVLMPNILEPLQQAVPRLFQWKNYDENVTVGWPQLLKGDPYNPSIRWDPFDQIYMDAPPLYLWTPITFEPVLVNPFKEGLGMDINVYVNNPGPLYADFGFLKTTLYHKDEIVATVINKESAVIKNVANGGDKFGVNKLVLETRFHLSKNPMVAWGEIMDIIHNFKNYRVDIEASCTEYGRIEWLTTIFQHLGDDMKGQIFPTLLALLHHVKFKVGPWSVAPPQKFIDAAQKILGRFDSKHFKILGTESTVEKNSFLAISQNWTAPDDAALFNHSGEHDEASVSESMKINYEGVTGSVPLS